MQNDKSDDSQDDDDVSDEFYSDYENLTQISNNDVDCASSKNLIMGHVQVPEMVLPPQIKEEVIPDKDINFNDTFDDDNDCEKVKSVTALDDHDKFATDEASSPLESGKCAAAAENEVANPPRKESFIQRAADALRATVAEEQKLSGDVCSPLLLSHQHSSSPGPHHPHNHPVLLMAMYTLAIMYNLLGTDALSILAYTLIIICMLAFVLMK